MNIAILGAAGFIGTNLALELSKNENNHLTLVDRNAEKLSRLKELCIGRTKLLPGNLVLQSDFDEALKGQDVIYHLISTTVPTTSNRHVSKEIKDNVEFMSELLEACVRCHVGKVVFLSSGGTVYGINSPCPLKEEMETCPINSYGMQKVMNEKLLYLYRYLHGLDYRIVRLANPFGPYQKPNGVQGAVAAFTYKALKKEEINVYGDGTVIRDYLYIDDAVRAIVNIADSKETEKIYNVGSGEGTSINELLKVIEKVLKRELHINYQSGRKVDVPANYLNISRYENTFGRLISVPLDEGIRRTACFMKKEYLC